MESDNKTKQKQIQIELDEKTSQGEYVNFSIVTHSPAEFVIDFATMLPGMPKAKVKSRILMTPPQTKTLMLILQDNIKKYEGKFGEIKMVKTDGQKQFNFKIPGDTLPN